MSNFEELRAAIIRYRVKCDMAFSDREENVVTQAEYEKAINWELDQVIKFAQSDMLRIVEEAKPDQQHYSDNGSITYYHHNGRNNGIDEYHQSLINHIKERKSDEPRN